MISTSGLPANLALKLINNKREVFETSIEKNTVNAREIKAFRERIGAIESPEALVADYEVYSFVMKAFDLESHIFGKAMIKKVLGSSPDEKGTTTSKMTDNRFKELSREMQFFAPAAVDAAPKEEDGVDLVVGADGADKPYVKYPKFQDPAWIEAMVDRYVGQKLINSELENNETVGTVLHFEKKASGITGWYGVLADTKLRDFFYGALGLPNMAASDLDRQVKVLSSKFDLTTLDDPKVRQKLTARYTAIAEANKAQESMSSNPILQLFTPSNSAITSISLDGLSVLNRYRYR